MIWSSASTSRSVMDRGGSARSHSALAAALAAPTTSATRCGYSPWVPVRSAIGGGELLARRGIRPRHLTLQRRLGHHQPDPGQPPLVRRLIAAMAFHAERELRLDRRPDRGPQRLVGRPRAQFGGDRQAAVDLPGGDRLGLAGEVVPERAQRNPGLGRDVLDPHVGQPALDRQPDRRPAQRDPRLLLLPLPQPFGHARRHVANFA